MRAAPEIKLFACDLEMNMLGIVGRVWCQASLNTDFLASANKVSSSESSYFRAKMKIVEVVVDINGRICCANSTLYNCGDSPGVSSVPDKSTNGNRVDGLICRRCCCNRFGLIVDPSVAPVVPTFSTIMTLPPIVVAEVCKGLDARFIK